MPCPRPLGPGAGFQPCFDVRPRTHSTAGLHGLWRRAQEFEQRPGVRCLAVPGCRKIDHVQPLCTPVGVLAGQFLRHGVIESYFVHSYAAPVGEWTIASSAHGQSFSAVVRQGNFLGAQFHPERSAACGARLLKNFLEA